MPMARAPPRAMGNDEKPATSPAASAGTMSSDNGRGLEERDRRDQGAGERGDARRRAPSW